MAYFVMCKNGSHKLYAIDAKNCCLFVQSIPWCNICICITSWPLTARHQSQTLAQTKMLINIHKLQQTAVRTMAMVLAMTVAMAMATAFIISNLLVLVSIFYEFLLTICLSGESVAPIICTQQNICYIFLHLLTF